MKLELGMRYHHASLAQDGVISALYSLNLPAHKRLSEPETLLLARILEQAIDDGDSVIHEALGVPLPHSNLNLPRSAADFFARFPRGVWFQPHELVKAGMFSDRIQLRSFLYNWSGLLFDYAYVGKRRVWRVKPGL